MKVMPPVEVVLVSICVNVLAAAGCVKFSEVLVSLVSFTINTESVLNLRTGDRAVVYCTRARYALCDERCSVQCTCCNVEVLYVHGDDCHSSGMLRQSVSSRHVCYGQCTCTCTWCLLRILTSSFCRLTLYGLSLPVRTRNALQNNGTPAVLTIGVHLY